MTMIEAEARSQAFEPVDLSQVVNTVATDLQAACTLSGLTLQADVMPEVPLVLGNAQHLQRVCENLVTNAIKFTPSGGHIHMRLWTEEQKALIEVSDTGIGIPEEKLPRIFDRFYQVDGSSKRRHGGAGLGLALVKEVVEAHGGQVTVDSQPGKGSKFVVSLPIMNQKE